ncbi:Maf family protein [Cryobacterium psychrophilum]|uniref:Nucleoside triphosphate pyrophosphatase n=1 Tax=Cryobacterium psychrophilum TaxID=41988 RepID=A0A4Y8KLV5_9MICO|nr:nucleoside triphosphate pyrophosphatase [Cryobacterium psychrophilum]TDW30666.1 septum formation protein [Cryobacterium psychrophilum]TFD77083.1 septum formation protein Maf [Cryobacterium psychrophilum]
MHLILASTSPARLALLRAAGIEPALVSPGVDEDAVTAEANARAGAPLGAHDVVELLARAKAEAAAALHVAATDAGTADTGASVTSLILGGDSVFVLDGVIYGKPHTAQKARERWQLQRGRTGMLYSGHWLIELVDGVPGRAVGAVAVSEVSFADDITDAELDAYIGTGEPLFVAGAFTIDSLGAPFITRIVGDPSAVVGLSLPTLRRLVAGLGHHWPDLWNRRGVL